MPPLFYGRLQPTQMGMMLSSREAIAMGGEIVIGCSKGVEAPIYSIPMPRRVHTTMVRNMQRRRMGVVESPIDGALHPQWIGDNQGRQQQVSPHWALSLAYNLMRG